MPTVTTAHRLLLPSILLLTVVLPVASPSPGSSPSPSVVPPPASVAPPRADWSARTEAAPVALAAPPVVISAHAPAVRAASVPRSAVAAPLTTLRATRSRPKPDLAPGWEARRGAEALELIGYRWQDLGWGISFHPARDGLLGLAHEPDRHIYVFVRRGQSVRSLAFTVAHEIGHAYDFTHGTRESHNRWRELRGIDRDVPWAGCSGCGDLETPAGDFAEVFAVWQVGPVDFRSRMAPLPSGERLRVLSEEFLENGPRASAA